MNKKILYALWGGMFILCAGLGFIQDPQEPVKWVLLVLSLIFFLPPALLLYGANRERDGHTLALIRNLSGLSLGLSLLGLILNILTAPGSLMLGAVMNVILTIVSAPMICSGQWALSLFLWACLLLESISLLKKLK